VNSAAASLCHADFRKRLPRLYAVFPEPSRASQLRSAVKQVSDAFPKAGVRATV
jgi:hypothetical protein